MMTITLSQTPVSQRYFQGIGVESDAVLYDACNQPCGVTEQDISLLETRLRSLKPAISRLFFSVDKVKTDYQTSGFDHECVYFRNIVRMLSLLQEIDCKVNVVLFSPYRVETEKLPDVVNSMVSVLCRLVNEEGISSINWLTLYNEPDSMFRHQSPLSESIFKDKAVLHSWDDYVSLTHHADGLLKEKGLYPGIKLVVADTVYGAPMRQERMKLCHAAFSALDVVYSYHNYNPEYREFYENASPDFHYEGMGNEAASFRKQLGPDRPLVIWEANLAGEGFSSHFPGTDRFGCHVLETKTGGVDLLNKIFSAINHGVDGFCLWCFNDIAYGNPGGSGIMRFGLGRYKYEHWTLRPYSHFYAVLCRHLRPGARILKLNSVADPINMLAAQYDDKYLMFIINTSDTKQNLIIDHPIQATEGMAMRLNPTTITDHMTFANEQWEPYELTSPLKTSLNPNELLVWQDSSLYQAN